MSEKDLCFDCRQAVRERYGAGAYYLPQQHCHHDPKWEPIQCRWCEAWKVFKKGGLIELEPKDSEFLSAFIKAAHYLITLGQPMTECPKCGAKL